jgi:threonine/homoserine/homoserine lactone efflux protein
MPDLHTLALFLSAGLALNLTPGPDMLYVATRSSGEGRAAGLVSALGIATGCLFHIGALALGLSAVLATVPALYDAVRYLGAAYLCYLGLRALLAPSQLDLAGQLEPRRLSAIFRQGVLTNVLNPKVALFFLALLPQFVDPARGGPAQQIIVLGLLFNTTGTIVNALVAIGASRATAWIRSRPRSLALVQRGTGAIFIGLGLRLAVSGRR